MYALRTRIHVQCLALLVTAFPAAAQSPAGDPYAPAREIIAGLETIVTPHGVDETFVYSLGGARQVINVRGADRSNLILVFIHGGPASPEMPLAWSFQRSWEDFLRVVQWDQRGAGRSFRLENPAGIAESLSPDQYRDDAIELIELLRQRYGQRKVVLLGRSFGSIIGLSVAIKRPDLLYAYIGVGQLIDGRENERVGFEWTLAKARADHNTEAVTALEALRPYPGSGALSLESTTVERHWNIHYGGLVANRSEADWYFHLGRLSPLYTPADRQAWDEGSAFTMKAVWPAPSDVRFGHINRIETPLFLLLGRCDYTTPSSIAADRLKRVRAPKKGVIWFEQSAHLPFVEEPGNFLKALLDVRSKAGLDKVRRR